MPYFLPKCGTKRTQKGHNFVETARSSTTSVASAVRKGNQLPATSSLALGPAAARAPRAATPPPPSSVMKSRRCGDADFIACPPHRFTVCAPTLPRACGKPVTPPDNLGAGRKESQCRRNHSKYWALAGRVFGRGEHDRNTTPNIGSIGGECGPLRKRAMAERLCR
jgi:hypothetical protein